MLKKILVSVFLFSAVATGASQLVGGDTPPDVQFSCMQYADQFGKRGSAKWLKAYEACICSIQACY
ncbi:hypothetical protein [Acanthopleuribacter pedis]|uniref:Uncharacterized protein n=1 Tax=Acanthopleuribacter pedis TaxID=442870 RepID=A0A8J7Q9M4_9BACT|nr:hypothetical protein [Acanthopleuribacter pedis]MBO1320460.1 hypothetical protein [Acanthopleuribacter pedis]